MILCCGEALIDFLPRKTAEGAFAYEPVCGGSVYNTAIALGRLGVPVGLFTGLSTDFFGDMLQEGLKASKVSLKYTKVWDKPSTLAFVKLTDGHARYSFFDDNSAGRMLVKRDLPKLEAKVQALHFGSISLIPEPGGDTLELLLIARIDGEDRVLHRAPARRLAVNTTHISHGLANVGMEGQHTPCKRRVDALGALFVPDQASGQLDGDALSGFGLCCA